MLDAINIQTKNHRHTHAQNRFAAIPFAEKLSACEELTGKGVFSQRY
ncbi:MAG TPA: hypothetical protein PKY59_00120 [Pyrinomonadaceae bacterium]|nr:hypothetical protein [Pyrinomonadaceae bacterium]